LARDDLGIDGRALPFQGVDIWTAFELSWLNQQGRPEVACAELRLPCNSPAIVESKSLKLYLNSLNQSVFDSSEAVAKIIQQDLSSCAGSEISVRLIGAADWQHQRMENLPGINIDQLDITTDTYLPDAGLLRIKANSREVQAFNSHLFRSLCPVTAQPDWASFWIECAGPQIYPDSLLQYLVSYRKHQGFHEQCVEKIFMDLMRVCQPQRLTVGARFTRRGGLDINPVRSTESVEFDNLRLFRQ
jgi:7-cyano-7-deazaguanine reductase